MALPWLELVLAPRDADSGGHHARAVGRGVRASHEHPFGSDRTLAERVRAGDVSAFEYLFRAHYTELVRFVESALGAHDTAEDVVQTVLWEVWERRDRLDADRPIRAYLFAAVRNRMRNVHRDSTLALRRAWESAVDAQMQKDDSSQEETREALALVTRLLDTLSERDREILLLRLRGLTFAEIGAVLGVPLKTVATRNARTLERLRQLVQKGESHDE